MQWVHGEPSITNPTWVPHVQWGSSHPLLFGSCLTFGGLVGSETGILEPHHVGSNGLAKSLLGWWMDPKFVEWWGLAGAAGVRITSSVTSGRCGILSLLMSARRQLLPWVITDLDSRSERQADVGGNIKTAVRWEVLHSLSHHGCGHWILPGLPFPNGTVYSITGMWALSCHSAERWVSSQLSRIGHS